MNEEEKIDKNGTFKDVNSIIAMKLTHVKYKWNIRVTFCDLISRPFKILFFVYDLFFSLLWQFREAGHVITENAVCDGFFHLKSTKLIMT